MYVLGIAIGVALVVGLLASLLVGSAWAGILPALIAAVGVYYYMQRRVGKQMEVDMRAVQQELETLQTLQVNSTAAREKVKNITDSAIQKLTNIKGKYAKWQPFGSEVLDTQMDAQIGMILFMREDYDKAMPYLEKSMPKGRIAQTILGAQLWMAQVMLATLKYNQNTQSKGKKSAEKSTDKNPLQEVDSILERASALAPKQGFLWSTWAYFNWKEGNAEKAQKILGQGQGSVGENADATLTKNLLNLQNGKKMDMKGYGMVWYQLRLEEHPAIMEQRRGGNMRFANR